MQSLSLVPRPLEMRLAVPNLLHNCPIALPYACILLLLIIELLTQFIHIEYLVLFFFVTGIISNPSESGILQWLGTILSYIFNGFWVLPVFWISKPINSIWFQVK